MYHVEEEKAVNVNFFVLRNSLRVDLRFEQHAEHWVVMPVGQLYYGILFDGKTHILLFATLNVKVYELFVLLADDPPEDEAC